MAWTNLDDVYVSANGGTIAGDLKVNGTLTINNKKGTNTTYDVASQITSLRDSVSPTKLYESSTWSVYAIGNMVWVCAYGVKTGSGSWDHTACPYNIPGKYRPNKTIIAPTITENGGSWTGVLKVESSGEIVVQNFGNAGSDDCRSGVLIFPI